MCRPPENSANDRIVQRCGVYHTPEEFVRKAANAGHPQSLETCFPAVLKNAIEAHKNSVGHYLPSGASEVVGLAEELIMKMMDWLRVEHLR